VTELSLYLDAFVDERTFRVSLADARGVFLGDHEVRIDAADPGYAAFVDLEGHLRSHCAPDRRVEDEARLVEEVGRWIGRTLLGSLAAKLVENPPAVVRMRLPALPYEALTLVHRPWELAYAGNQPLALQDVSLVFELPAEPAREPEPVGERLRVLAVFSQPRTSTALALRAERRGLEHSVRQVTQSSRRDVHLRAIQYGVTQAALAEALEEGEGWDIVHFSGHGLAGGLVLEASDGTEDVVDPGRLARLLRLARPRLKLVTLSSCASAAATLRETSDWLGLPAVREPRRAQRTVATSDLPALARAVVEEIGCAVLAMRYPVADAFATALTDELYRQLLERGNMLPRALQIALPKALGDGPAPGRPSLSVATPALLGRQAATLRLQPPPRAVKSFAPPASSLREFPPEPGRFVGRVGLLAECTAALMPRSDRRAVVLYGLAGGGKTAAALELAYRHHDRFGGFAFYKVRDRPEEAAGALVGLAWALESQLPDFRAVDKVGADEPVFRAFLPTLRDLMEREAVFVFVDNLEPALTSDGSFRDPRLRDFVRALVDHSGLGRVVLTSRMFPADLLDDPRVLARSVSGLHLDEATLLARELPHLGRLLEGRAGTGGDAAAQRALVRRVLLAVQGHPKLLELADTQASDPGRLANALDHAERRLSAVDLDAFFRTQESGVDPDLLLSEIREWTRTVVATLDEGARTLFSRLCCLEEEDRFASIVQQTWAELVGRLDALCLAALIERKDDELILHPAVADAGRSDDVQREVDREVGNRWVATARQAMGPNEDSDVVARAALHAAPYLIRLGEYETAGSVLDAAGVRDQNPATAWRLERLLRTMIDATGDVRATALLGRSLLARRALPEAASCLEKAVSELERAQHWHGVRVAAADLFNVYRELGLYAAALAVLDRKKNAGRRAQLGRWEELSDEAQRLQILRMGDAPAVLEAVEGLLDDLDRLPESEDGSVHAWVVREGIFHVGALAARDMRCWQQALRFNARVRQSQKRRGAPRHERAITWFNDYTPLLELERLHDAEKLLGDCREAFELDGDFNGLGLVFGALADLTGRRGRPHEAAESQRISLRYCYTADNPETCCVGHHNLASYLLCLSPEADQALAHLLAAGVLSERLQQGRPGKTFEALAQHPRPFPAWARSFDAVADRVERTDGVRFRKLVASLPGPSPQQTLDAVLRRA